jgi:hypothetical protein
VTTIEQLATLGGSLHVHHTNWAFLLESSLYTLVLSFHRNRQATFARLTVEEINCVPCSADTTAITMEEALSISIIVVQTTHFTIVLSEVLLAINAGSGLGLNLTTSEALDFGYLVSVQLMVLLWV